MRPRDTQLRDREPLPAMLAGDEGGAAPAALVLPHEHEIAALLPDDLRVAIEGTSASRLLLIAVGLLAALVLGLVWTEGTFNPVAQFLVVVGACGALAWLAHRELVRRRREFRLVDGGITVEVTPLAGGPPRVTHVPWTEIADYTVSVDYEKAFLRVVSARGYTLTLDDRPPRLSTRELIRRFVEQADRYPRAAEPQPRREGSPLPDVTGVRAPALRGCLAFLAVCVAGGYAEAYLNLSLTQETIGITIIGVIGVGVALWLDLDDPEIVAKDAESNGLAARLRRWLRRVLRVRVG